MITNLTPALLIIVLMYMDIFLIAHNKIDFLMFDILLDKINEISNLTPTLL